MLAVFIDELAVLCAHLVLDHPKVRERRELTEQRQRDRQRKGGRPHQGNVANASSLRKPSLVGGPGCGDNPQVPPAPTPDALEQSAPRPAPLRPLPASNHAVLALFDRGLLDARTSRDALGRVRRGRTLEEILEECGVPRSLREKADAALRPLSTRLDGATLVALSLTPPAVAALVGELSRLGGDAAAVAIVLAGALAAAQARHRSIKACGAAAAASAALTFASSHLSTTAAAGAVVALLLASAVAFAAHVVGPRARSAASGCLAAAMMEALRQGLASLS